ncbi:MAG: TetR/AcrR family transcriptional regulator [Chloroflexota bacterium]
MTEQTRPPERELPTQEQIIQSAHRLFLQNGYHATSMRQIAQAAGLAVGSIYNHFPGKEQIYLAVLQRYHPLFEILPTLSQSTGNTVEELVRNAAQLLVEHLKHRQDFLNLILIELVEFRAQHVPAMMETNMPLLIEFTQNFTQGKPELRPIPPFILVRAFLGLFFAYFITELLFGGKFPFLTGEHTLDTFLDIFLNGILIRQETNS